jgi:hypothetical protein
MCDNLVTVDHKMDGTPILTKCGHTSPTGDVALCNSCLTRLRKQYPQGWRYTPGDVCKHGCYVGDAYGPDYMCPNCEMGYD